MRGSLFEPWLDLGFPKVADMQHSTEIFTESRNVYLQPLQLMKGKDSSQDVNLVWWEKTMGYCTEDKDTSSMLNTMETM